MYDQAGQKSSLGHSLNISVSSFLSYPPNLNRAEHKIENEGELIKLIISHEDSPPLKEREDYNCDCMGNTEPTVEQGMNLTHVASGGNCCVNARLYAYNYLFN